MLFWPGTPSLDHGKAFCGTNLVVTFVRGLQYLAETQKLEELQLKQSRQFIPVVPKALVSELVLLSHRGVILGTAVPFCGCVRPPSHWSHLKRILGNPVVCGPPLMIHLYVAIRAGPRSARETEAKGGGEGCRCCGTSYQHESQTDSEHLPGPKLTLSTTGSSSPRCSKVSPDSRNDFGKEGHSRGRPDALIVPCRRSTKI